MRSPAWVIVLLLTTAAPVSLYGEGPCCPCPKEETPVEEAPAEAAPSTTQTPTTEAQAVHEKKFNYGLPIHGGKSPEKAVAIECNRDYRLSHHQKKGSKDYFSLQLEPGMELTLGLKVLDKGISLSRRRSVETNKPYAGLELLGPDGGSLEKLTISGQPRQLERATFKPFDSGRYLLVVGSGEGDMHRAQVVFKASLVMEAMECAVDGERSRPLIIDLPLTDCFGEGDDKDFFDFAGRRKEVYRIEIALTEPGPVGLRARLGLLRRRKGLKTLADASGSGDRVTIESITLPHRGIYSLEVTPNEPAARLTPYTVTLTKLSDGKRRKR